MTSSSRPLKILLADDSASIRTVLAAMLVDLGHEVAAVVDGVEAVTRFEQQYFDMVLLDVVMPNMDGYEATRRIKALAEQQNRWVPIIVISATEDNDAAIRGLDSGAEDFLYKPVHPRFLSAKIDSYARSLEFYHRLILNEQRATAISEKLARINEEITADMEIATGVMDRLIFKDALEDPQLNHHLVPASQLSGDLVAAVRAPNDLLYVMVADATGHGLSAAISLLPALWVFYGMARKECTVPEIVAAINSRLKETVPIGRFVAAHVASINNPARTVRLWSGGMPPAYFIDNGKDEIRTLRSPHLALGIMPPALFDPATEIIEWKTACQMFFCSDGLTEAQNEAGEMFGDERLQQLLQGKDKAALFPQIVAAVEAHMNQQPAMDDISLLRVLLP